MAYSLLDVETERIEVLHGPASVVWSSSAIGGVINIITKPPCWRTGRSCCRLIRWSNIHAQAVGLEEQEWLAD